MEYGFVEKWIAEITGEPYTPWVVSDGVESALVSRSVFDMASKTIEHLWEKHNSPVDVPPLEQTTHISGMKILMHKYWISPEIFDALTSADTKRTSEYQELRKPENMPFDANKIQAEFKIIYDIVSGKTVDETMSVGEAEEGVAEAISDEERSKNLIEDKSRMFIEYLEQDLMQRHQHARHEAKNEKHVIMFGQGGFWEDPFLTMAENINKNIIVLTDEKSRSHLAKINKKFDLRELEEHTILINTRPGALPVFSPMQSNTHHKCYGKDVEYLYTVKGEKSIVAVDIENDSSLSREQKNERLKKLEASESVYSKYDAIYKDSITNITWALKDRSVIYMMFEVIQNKPFARICFEQLALRLKGGLSREDIESIDKEFYAKIIEQNKEEYIKFVIDNATNVIKKLEDSKAKADEKYEKARADAEEFGKLSNKLMDQIAAFDTEKFETEQTKRALDAYEETINIPKVRSINISDQTINVYTDNLYCQDERSKKWHDIGTFHIKIGMESNKYDPESTTRIINTKHHINAYQAKMNAPHVYADGKMCAGNAANSLTESYAKRNLHDLIYGIIIFLESANTSDSAGEHVNKWPEVDEATALGQQVQEEEKDESEEAFDESLSEHIAIHI